MLFSEDTNMLNETDYAMYRRDLWVQGYGYVYYIMKIVVMTLAIGLNVTVLVTIKHSKRLRKIPYLYMSSLAVSDLTFACNGIIHCSIVSTALYSDNWPSFEMAQSFGTGITFVFFVSMFSTYGNLILISLERWVYISQPFWYQRVISPRVAVSTIAVVWSVAAIANVDILITGGNFPAISTQLVRYGIVFPVTHFLWCIIICSIYTHISAIALRHVKAMKKTSSVGMPEKINTADLRLVLLKRKLVHTRMLLFVFGSFFILLTPNVCCNIYSIVLNEINGGIIGFAKLMLCAHSSTNFFVYAFQDKDFKLALRKIFGNCGFGRFEPKVYPIQVYSSSQFNTGYNKKLDLSLDVNNVEGTLFAQIKNIIRMTEDYHVKIPGETDKSTYVQQHGPMF